MDTAIEHKTTAMQWGFKVLLPSVIVSTWLNRGQHLLTVGGSQVERHDVYGGLGGRLDNCPFIRCFTNS